MLAVERILIGFALSAGIVCAAGSWDGTVVHHGTMHEAIGQQRHEGRVALSELVGQPHFYGVAALEKLAGEVTIHDGRVTVTGVDSTGRLQPIRDSVLEREATLLVGAYVASWTEHRLSKAVDDFDGAIAEAANRAGLEISRPFVFTLEGRFAGLRYHVINGACPVHARKNEIEIPAGRRPFESELENVRGTIVGVFAEGAAGKLTHPGTSTHSHVIFEDEAAGTTVTGHVEWVELSEGAVLRLPGQE